jgi:hypothetical protein
MNQLALLRQYEPIARFTHGEQFYPLDVERYLARCSLWVQRPNEPPTLLLPRGQLTPARLVAPDDEHPGAVQYLSFVDPVGPATVRAFYRSSSLKDFRAGRGRLARVGLVARIADVLFSVTLLARGRVPGGLAVAAALAYQQMQADQPRFTYYGRVAEQDGYTVLQYWFFYAFNDWRSSFYGVNDHESDWEMISVYLAGDAAGQLEPRWLAYSSHEFFGDDLRRRWDDPEVEKIGDHPVVYVAAGSHANLYRAGEYLPVAEIPYTQPLVRALLQIRRTWNRLLRQASDEIAPQEVTIFRIPFVDYARGDGTAIGPGQAQSWDAQLLDPPPTWLSDYRGLWGLFTRDPISGEDAPAGPLFDRDGTPRRMWFDPVGWSGLDKVAPPLQRLSVLDEQRARHDDELHALEQQIHTQTRELMALQTEIEAISGTPHLRLHLNARRKALRAASRELARNKERAANLRQLLDALDRYEVRVAGGDPGPLRAHIRVPQQPVTPAELRLSRVAETWSALSSGFLLIGFVLLLTFTPRGWLIGLLGLIGVYALVEALFRRQAQLLLRNVVVSLATITGLLLAFEFLRELLIAAVLAIGLLIIVENIRELRT